MYIYYLDSNICIYYFRHPSGKVADKIDSISHSQIKLPSIVKAELLTGAMKSIKSEQEFQRVMTFCRPFEIVPFDDSMTKIYGEIRAKLERIGKRIGFNDLLIAATVIAKQGILVTNNINEFSRIERLYLDDWTA